MTVFAAVRAVHFASLMTIFGAGAYSILLRHRLPTTTLDEQRLRFLFRVAAVLALLTAFIWMDMVSVQMSADPGTVFGLSTISGVIRTTRFGQIFLARLVGLVVLLIVCFRRRVAGNVMPPILTGLLLAALALTSHAAASGRDDIIAVIHAANDASHLLAGGFWLGGLVTLVLLARTYREQPAGLIAPLRLFSLWGFYAVAILVTTGVANAGMIFSVSSATLSETYGGVLLTKIILALAMIGLAVLNRRRVASALDTDAAALNHLGLTISAEIMLGLAVIGLAGYAGLLPPQ